MILWSYYICCSILVCRFSVLHSSSSLHVLKNTEYKALYYALIPVCIIRDRSLTSFIKVLVVPFWIFFLRKTATPVYKGKYSKLNFIVYIFQHEVYTSWLENMFYFLLGRPYSERKLFKERGSWCDDQHACHMVEKWQVSHFDVRIWMLEVIYAIEKSTCIVESF